MSILSPSISHASFARDRMIPIMISRFTLALKKAFGKDSGWDDDLLTNKSFVPHAPTPHNTREDVVRRSVDLEAAWA